ncbi:MAG TPA: lipopolysaccharide heptosyltransferase II [Terriglobales bacterium]|nr:lipopolysaccharide heptosyltransferase II [Terriglobales bacterium]
MPRLAIPERASILVKHVNWLGDVVMSQPALRALRRAFPRARLTVLIKQDLAGFFEGAPWLDEVLPYRFGHGWRGIADRLRLSAELRRRRFDVAVLFADSFDAAWWPALARIPRRIGYARDARRLLLTDPIDRAPQVLTGHQVGYRLALLRAGLGISGDPGDFAVDVSAAARSKMQRWLAERRLRPQAPLIALAAGAAYGPAKEWPASHYAELIDRLSSRDGSECVLVGAPSERAKSQAVAAASRSGALVAAGETGVAELIALLSLCDGFAGNDSGAMHVAGALGLPTIGIFGSTRPERTAPLGPRTQVLYRGIECSPCLARDCRFGHYRCLQEISAAEVLGAFDATAGLPQPRTSR